MFIIHFLSNLASGRLVDPKLRHPSRRIRYLSKDLPQKDIQTSPFAGEPAFIICYPQPS
jgi:hypothetical protein